MIDWDEAARIYIHRDPVDFRKSINGLTVIVQDSMLLSPFDPALFIFCNRSRTQVKALYWDQTGFALWQKRLEKDRFKWPKRFKDNVSVISTEQWQWLLRGFDLTQFKPHQSLSWSAVG